MWDLIVSVPDHCLSFFFTTRLGKLLFADILLEPKVPYTKMFLTYLLYLSTNFQNKNSVAYFTTHLILNIVKKYFASLSININSFSRATISTLDCFGLLCVELHTLVFNSPVCSDVGWRFGDDVCNADFAIRNYKTSKGDVNDRVTVLSEFKLLFEPAHEIMVLITGDQRRLRRACTSTQSRQSLRCRTHKNRSRRRLHIKIRHPAPSDGCASMFKERVYGGRKCHKLVSWLILFSFYRSTFKCD